MFVSFSHLIVMHDARSLASDLFEQSIISLFLVLTFAGTQIDNSSLLGLYHLTGSTAGHVV